MVYTTCVPNMEQQRIKTNMSTDLENGLLILLQLMRLGGFNGLFWKSRMILLLLKYSHQVYKCKMRSVWPLKIDFKKAKRFHLHTVILLDHWSMEMIPSGCGIKHEAVNVKPCEKKTFSGNFWFLLNIKVNGIDKIQIRRWQKKMCVSDSLLK